MRYKIYLETSETYVAERLDGLVNSMVDSGPDLRPIVEEIAKDCGADWDDSPDQLRRVHRMYAALQDCFSVRGARSMTIKGEWVERWIRPS